MGMDIVAVFPIEENTNMTQMRKDAIIAAAVYTARRAITSGLNILIRKHDREAERRDPTLHREGSSGSNDKIRKPPGGIT